MTATPTPTAGPAAAIYRDISDDCTPANPACEHCTDLADTGHHTWDCPIGREEAEVTQWI